MSSQSPNGKKKLAIMRAVERLVETESWAHVTTDRIAAEAGVGKGTIYRYFTDKDDLLFEVASSGFEDLCERLRDPMPDHANFGDELLEAARRISEFFQSRHNLIRMMQAQENMSFWKQPRFRERWAERRNGLIDALAQLLQRGVADGRVRNDIDCRALASYLLGMMRTRAREWHDLAEPSRTLEVVLDLFCRGAAPSVTLESIDG